MNYILIIYSYIIYVISDHLSHMYPWFLYSYVIYSILDHLIYSYVIYLILDHLWYIIHPWFICHLNINYILFTYSYLILDFLLDMNPWYYLPFTHQLHIIYTFICNTFNIGSSLIYESIILFVNYTSITYYLHIHA